MAQAPFVVQPELTAIAIAYRNQRYIADTVLPRIPVGSQQFKWSQHTLADSFTIPDTRVGRKSAPNEIDWTATEQTSSCIDYGLDDRVAGMDVESARAAAALTGGNGIDPRMRSTELLSELVALDREQRVANLLFTLGTYPAANRTTLSGTSQWSDRANSDPITALLNALDVPIYRPNVLVLGQAVWTSLRQHPRAAAAIFPAGGNAGAGGSPVSRQALAEVLEIEEVVVGQGWVNSAKLGQTPSMGRLWGKHAALIYRAPVLAGTENTMTFGFTAQWGSRIAGTIGNDSSIGLRGGERVRVGESVREVIAANDVAYFFQNAVA
ncbi:MAG: hypothetical protein RJA99_4291 [Pseudomonadota bacterium]|jgi:hypothetical protein